ncbi:MAG: hypothetical protein WD272_09470, partial [Balneolales bacterium]
PPIAEDDNFKKSFLLYWLFMPAAFRLVCFEPSQFDHFFKEFLKLSMFYCFVAGNTKNSHPVDQIKNPDDIYGTTELPDL